MKEKIVLISFYILCVVIFVLLIIGGYFLYDTLFVYYPAEDIAKEYLVSTDDVKVEYIDDYYFFDGPGEDNAIVFYPGAKVEFTAYAPLMYKLAEKGIDTFLVKMPYNFAFFNANAANKIIKNNNYNNWYISGHSLGGVVISSQKYDNIKGIIFLASYPNKKIPDNIKALCITGDQDGVINLDKYNKNGEKYWNNNTKGVFIEGGNHANFAYYGKQKGDMVATIAKEEQIDTTIELIMDFIG